MAQTLTAEIDEQQPDVPNCGNVTAIQLPGGFWVSATGEHKIKVSIGLTPRTETAISAEARRQGISFADQMRRITDRWADDWSKRQEKPPEKILVLDRESGALRSVR